MPSDKSAGVFIYPGSFDPVTLGHLDVIKRAARMCGRLIIAVGQNGGKNSMFTVRERMEMLEASIGGPEGTDVAGSALRSTPVEIVSFGGLLADFARKRGAGVIIKGLRTISDFEFEMQMALTNKYLDDCLETIFVMTSLQYAFLSSSAVKEIALRGGRLDGLVPLCVMDKIRQKANYEGVND